MGLEKAVVDAKDARTAMRAGKEELRQAGQIAAGKPLWIWQRVLLMRPNTFEIKKTAKWKGFSGRSSRIQSIHWQWTIVWLNGRTE